MATKNPTTLKELSVRIAKAKDIEPGDAAKQLRTRIRSNFSVVEANWPALKAQGKENRDGNRYPPVPPTLADALFNALTKGTSVKEALAKPKKERKPKATPAPEAPAES
jgi:hypothetical protein